MIVGLAKITFDTGGLKPLNLGFSWLAIPHYSLTLMMCDFTITLIERLLSDIVIPMEMGIWKSKELDSRSTDCGNDRLHSFLKTQKTKPHRLLWKSYLILKPVWFLAFPRPNGLMAGREKTKAWLQLSPDWKTPRTLLGQFFSDFLQKLF